MLTRVNFPSLLSLRRAVATAGRRYGGPSLRRAVATAGRPYGRLSLRRAHAVLIVVVSVQTMFHNMLSALVLQEQVSFFRLPTVHWLLPANPGSWCCALCYLKGASYFTRKRTDTAEVLRRGGGVIS